MGKSIFRYKRTDILFDLISEPILQYCHQEQDFLKCYFRHSRYHMHMIFLPFRNICHYSDRHETGRLMLQIHIIISLLKKLHTLSPKGFTLTDKLELHHQSSCIVAGTF